MKVFILVGQSNMLGHGQIDPATTPGTLAHTVANDPAGIYQSLVKSSGGWVVRDDVWIRDQNAKLGGLTVAYGANTTKIGPEIGFGHAVGDLYEQQVLLVKCAWGGKSLGKDFLPPSSGPYPAPVADGDTGYYYQQVLTLVNQATTNLATYFPNYDGGGYEIAGFCWHQGWNDRIDAAFSAAYETNMKNFINDMRRDLGAPNMAFVIATSGMDDWVRRMQVELAQLAMANASAHPAFAGNVAVVDTRLPYEGMRFWHLSSESPRSEGYHWNWNAKTYTNIGFAMADLMSLMVPPRGPYRLKASGGAAGVTLTWEDGREAATSVQVLRDGLEIAAAAPVSPASFVDTGAVPGKHQYQLNFTMTGAPSAPLRLEFDAGITDLEGYRFQNLVKLKWSNHLNYDAIQIRRNGVVIEPALAGSATAYTDTLPPLGGQVTYSVVPTHGSATPAEVTVDMSGLWPGNVYVYEPFDDSNLSLYENRPGTGLSRVWTAGVGLNIVANSMAYGALPTSGNQTYNAGALTVAAAVLRPEFADAGLLDHGKEIWFSFLTNNTVSSNTAVYFCLGTDKCGFTSGMEDGGQGIGVNIHQGKSPQAAVWSPARSAGTSTGNITTDTTALVVGRIRWGADAASQDTVEIFLPGTNLELPASPVSTKTAVLDQSKFKVLCFGGKNAGSPKIDEIRVGKAYADVIGAGARGHDYAVWTSGFAGPNLNDPLADVDGDGKSNDLERIWGSDPASGQGNGAVTAPLDPGAGTFSYRRRDDALTGLTYSVWTSSDLKHWTQDTGAEQTEGAPDSNEVETVAVTVSSALLNNSKLFIQVRAD